MSVLYSWCNEIKKWAPSLKYLRFHSSATDDVSIHEEDLSQYDMVVTTYEMVKSQNLRRIWQRQTFHLLVLDEGHRIKCEDTQTAQAVRKIHCETRIILTGTPLANNLVEMYSLLNFLAPDVFTTSEPFADAFDLTNKKVDTAKLDQAHSLLSVFMLRRLKEKVEKLMPKMLETKIVCPLSTMQIWWYKAILLKDIGLLANGTGSNGQLANLIMQLRKCCLHPFLFDGAEDIESTTLETLIGASGKLAVLDKLLCSLYEKKHRVCLFSQFTQVLDILEDYCTMRGWKFCRFDGSTARAKRNYVVNAFNAPDSDKFIFLMSTRSGSMGLNLQTADTCILYDSDWNPALDNQAMARGK
jgi:SWI/SNF-related matrix-associated actin-dependent regulator of chromatin subfamily A member 5